MKVNDTTRPEELTRHAYSAMAVGFEEHIVAEEAKGQSELTHSEEFPREGSEGLLKLGFEFPKDDSKDSLFRTVLMPEGWEKKKTDHHLWTALVDPHGNKRGVIFYKAAFYDRRAFMKVSTRYSVRTYYDNINGYEVRDNQTDKVLFKNTGNLFDFEEESKLEEEAVAWLKERYPEYEDPAAYWNEEEEKSPH